MKPGATVRAILVMSLALLILAAFWPVGQDGGFGYAAAPAGLTPSPEPPTPVPPTPVPPTPV
ncbi:MAG: hypothetical protein WHX53_13095, partial [Anaerolineae bacterium]